MATSNSEIAAIVVVALVVIWIVFLRNRKQPRLRLMYEALTAEPLAITKKGMGPGSNITDIGNTWIQCFYKRTTDDSQKIVEEIHCTLIGRPGSVMITFHDGRPVGWVQNMISYKPSSLLDVELSNAYQMLERIRAATFVMLPPAA